MLVTQIIPHAHSYIIVVPGGQKGLNKHMQTMKTQISLACME